MIDFSDKTFDKILSDMLERVDDGLNKRDGSLIKTSLAAAAWAIEGIYLNLSYLQNQAFPSTASGQNLNYIAESVGLSRKPAVKATWYAASNAQIPVGTRFSYAESDEKSVYFVSIDTSEPFVHPTNPDLVYLTPVQCETAGADANDYRGNLQSVDFVNGLTQVVLYTISIPGADEETDEALRTRYFEEVGQVEFGGNISAYRNYIKTISGVGAVEVFPVWHGAGTVLCSVLSDQYVPITQDKIDEIQLLVCPPEAGSSTPSPNGYGMAPIGAEVTITTPNAQRISINASVRKLTGSPRLMEDIVKDIKRGIKDYITQLCMGWEQLSTFNRVSYSLVMNYNKILGIMSNVEGVDLVVSMTLNGGTTDVTFVQNGTVGGQNVPVYSDDDITITEAPRR